MTEKKQIDVKVTPIPYHRLGAWSENGGIHFAIAPETDREVELLLYRDGEETSPLAISLPMQSGQGLVRSIHVSGIKADRISYMYRIDGTEMPDPAAALFSGRDQYGESHKDARCRIINRSFDWKEEQGPLNLPYEEVISYLVHVRGFTKQKGSGVRHPGTFKGIEEKIPYLTDLGINQIVLMPAYEFDEQMQITAVKALAPYLDPKNDESEKKTNYWGYGKGYYFAPKAAYAAGKTPDLEFKSLVRALHLNGIELIMEFAFGSDVNVDYISQCLSFWHREYHVDGFVLMTDDDKIRALSAYPALAGVKLMASYFDTKAVYPRGRKMAYRSLADMNDGFKYAARHLLKSDEGTLKTFVDQFKKNGRDKAAINYITNHDGFTLADLVSYNEKHNEMNDEGNRDGNADEVSWNCGEEGPVRKKSIVKLRMQQMKNAMAMLLLAQGVPMLLAGDEFGNSQEGNNNPWCQDNEIAHLTWKAQRSHKELTEFVKMLIAFRKSHSVLHQAQPLNGGDIASCGFPDISCHAERAWYVSYEPEQRHVGIMLSGKEDAYLYLAFNLHWEEQEFALPYLPQGREWKLMIDTGSNGDLSDEKDAYAERICTVPGRCIRVYEGVSVEAEGITDESSK